MTDVDEQRTTAAETQPDSPRFLLWFTSMLVAVFILYPLSIGPVARACGLTPPVLDVYRPIIHLCGSSLTGERVLDWYLGVWGVDMGRYR